MASLALEHVVEKGDPAFPVLFKSQNPWSKLIGDNPDTNYYFCTIDAQYDYRVWGNTFVKTHLHEGAAALEAELAGATRDDATRKALEHGIAVGVFDGVEVHR